MVAIREKKVDVHKLTPQEWEIHLKDLVSNHLPLAWLRGFTKLHDFVRTPRSEGSVPARNEACTVHVRVLNGPAYKDNGYTVYLYCGLMESDEFGEVDGEYTQQMLMLTRKGEFQLIRTVWKPGFVRGVAGSGVPAAVGLNLIDLTVDDANLFEILKRPHFANRKLPTRGLTVLTHLRAALANTRGSMEAQLVGLGIHEEALKRTYGDAGISD
ncbi:hypothetical protein BH11PAT2_BH11PAT2_06380 [soil metagenome]